MKWRRSSQEPVYRDLSAESAGVLRYPLEIGSNSASRRNAVNVSRPRGPSALPWRWLVLSNRRSRHRFVDRRPKRASGTHASALQAPLMSLWNRSSNPWLELCRSAGAFPREIARTRPVSVAAGSSIRPPNGGIADPFPSRMLSFIRLSLCCSCQALDVKSGMERKVDLRDAPSPPAP